MDIKVWAVDSCLRLYDHPDNWMLSIGDVTRLMLCRAIFLFHCKVYATEMIKRDEIPEGHEEDIVELRDEFMLWLNENGIPHDYFGYFGQPFDDFDAMFDEMASKVAKQSEEWGQDCFSCSVQDVEHQLLYYLGEMRNAGLELPTRKPL